MTPDEAGEKDADGDRWLLIGLVALFVIAELVLGGALLA